MPTCHPMSKPSGIVERALGVLARETTREAAPPAATPGESFLGGASGTAAIEDLKRQASQWIDRVLALASASAAGTGGAVPPGGVVVPGNAADRNGWGPVPAVPPRAALDRALTLAPPSAVRPGAVANLPMRLANDDAIAARLSFAATELIGESGHRIPASSVSFSPPSPLIPPGENTAVGIEVAVPSGTPAGQYAGVVQIIGQPGARKLISIEVR